MILTQPDRCAISRSQAPDPCGLKANICGLVRIDKKAIDDFRTIGHDPRVIVKTGTVLRLKQP